MKRINPKTGKFFTRGDQRDDGLFFYRYRKTISPKNGFFHMEWMSKKRFEKFKGINKIKVPQKRLNPKNGKLFRPGDKRDSDNRIFLRYRNDRIDRYGYFYEVWEIPSKRENNIKKKNEKNKIRKKINFDNFKKGNLIRRKNTVTKEYFRFGYKREDGLIFNGYDYRSSGKDGYVGERWSSEDVYNDTKLIRSFKRIETRSKTDGIKFNLTIKYLREIFPKDMICPVLKIRMEWGEKNRRISPSLDRFIPELGYVKGNVRWISNISNTIKSDRNFEIIKKIYLDLKK